MKKGTNKEQKHIIHVRSSADHVIFLRTYDMHSSNEPPKKVIFCSYLSESILNYSCIREQEFVNILIVGQCAVCVH